jgi:hypothetical protein
MGSDERQAASPLSTELDPIHRILSSNPRELAKRCSDGHREVFAAARGHAHVFFQYGCSFIRRYRYKPYVDTTAMGNHRIAVRSFEVSHPVRDSPEHRDDIALPSHRRDYHSVRPDTPGYTIADF